MTEEQLLEIETLFGDKVGTIKIWAGFEDQVPRKWMICDGRRLDKNVHNKLYKAIGDLWTNSNISEIDFFNIPDLRGLFIRGANGNLRDENDDYRDDDVSSRVRLNSFSGATKSQPGSLQLDAIRNISGQFGNGDDNFPVDGKLFKKGGDAGDASSHPNPGKYVIFNASRVVPTGKDNRPKNAFIHYIIKCK